MNTIPEDTAVIATTPRLVLRRMTDADFEWAAELDTDPEVMRYITRCVPTPRGEFEGIFSRMLQWHDAGPQYGFYAAVLRETGEVVGWFHLRPEKQEPFEMEVGYRLFRTFWGQGLATEGSVELIRLAFEEWHLPKVVAHTLAANGPSRRVLEKCGMHLEGAFVAPDSRHPGWSEEERRTVRYAIERR